MAPKEPANERYASEAGARLVFQKDLGAAISRLAGRHDFKKGRVLIRHRIYHDGRPIDPQSNKLIGHSPRPIIGDLEIGELMANTVHVTGSAAGMTQNMDAAATRAVGCEYLSDGTPITAADPGGTGSKPNDCRRLRQIGRSQI